MKAWCLIHKTVGIYLTRVEVLILHKTVSNFTIDTVMVF